jgi:hypothetical protein
MGRLLRGLLLGLFVGALAVWLWRQRQPTEATRDEASSAPSDLGKDDDRIVLPDWTTQGSAPSPAVHGRIILPNGAEATSEAEINTQFPDEGQELAIPLSDQPNEGETNSTEEGYCVRCKEQRRMVNVRAVMTANKRPALKGECAVCGAGIFKLVKA